MPDQPYTVTDAYGDATEAHANPDPVWVTEWYGGPALIVTGDVDAARRRLAPIPADTRTAALDVATAAEGEWRFGVNHDRRNLREAIVDALVAAGLIRPAHDDDAIERAARAAHAVAAQVWGSAPWGAIPPLAREKWADIARAALAAADQEDD